MLQSKWVDALTGKPVEIPEGTEMIKIGAAYMPRIDEAFETNIPKDLQLCKYCRSNAVISVYCRHGREFPACYRDAGLALEDAYKYDGDHGEVTVYHLRWKYDHQDPKEAVGDQ